MDEIKKYDMKDVWFHDENMPQVEVDFMNAAFREAAEIDPRFEKLIWVRSAKRNP